jgi:hypothetical protein
MLAPSERRVTIGYLARSCIDSREPTCPPSPVTVEAWLGDATIDSSRVPWSPLVRQELPIESGHDPVTRGILAPDERQGELMALMMPSPNSSWINSLSACPWTPSASWNRYTVGSDTNPGSATRFGWRSSAAATSSSFRPTASWAPFAQSAVRCWPRTAATVHTRGRSIASASCRHVRPRVRRASSRRCGRLRLYRANVRTMDSRLLCGVGNEGHAKDRRQQRHWRDDVEATVATPWTCTNVRRCRPVSRPRR